jgi:hypothetical protein
MQEHSHLVSGFNICVGGEIRKWLNALLVASDLVGATFYLQYRVRGLDNWLFVGGRKESGFVIFLIKSLRETAKFGILRRRSFLLSGFRYCGLALSLLE